MSSVYDSSMRLVCTGALLALAATPARADGPLRPVSKARPGNCENPLWSPDGKNLAYERNFIKERRIEINVIRDVSPEHEGREEVLLPASLKSSGGGAGDWAHGAAQKSKAAAFDSVEEIKPGQICHDFAWGPPPVYAYACNAGTYQLFGNGGAQLTHGSGAAGQPDWNPVNGKKLVFVSAESSRGQIFTYDADAKPQVKALLPPESKAVQLTPAWDPKGQSLAFARFADEGGGDLYVLDPASPGTKPRRLTQMPGDESNPTWSPDGTKIAFYATTTASGKAELGKKRSQVQFDIYVVDAAGNGDPYLVARNVVAADQAGPAWTPDGKWIIFVRKSADKYDPLVAVEAEPKGKEVTLPTGTQSNADPAVSPTPDAWKLAFTAIGTKGDSDQTWRKVYVYPLDALKAGTLVASSSPEEEAPEPPKKGPKGKKKN